jgi:L-iditol 2-dehydrogenase
VIAKVGSQVQHWAMDDRVTFDSTIYSLDDFQARKGLYNLADHRQVLGISCNEYRRDGAMAEYVAIPQHLLYRIPEGVSFDQAAMVEPAAVAAHAIRLTPLVLNDTAVVIGCGMIGLFLIQILAAAGAGTIIAVDVDQERLNLAKDFGADTAIDANQDEPAEIIRQLNHGRGAQVAFEAVGHSSTIKTAVECLDKGATLTLVGNVSPTAEIPLQKVVIRQLRLQGSCAICGEYPAVLEMIRRRTIDVDSLQSFKAPLAEGATWFAKLYQKEKGIMKVLLHP